MRFTTSEAGGSEDEVGQYRAAFRETFSAGPGAGVPARSRHVIYSERPAEVEAADPRRVAAVVRRYELAQIKPPPDGPPPDVEGLTIWYRPRSEAPIRVLSPTRDLQPWETELVSSQVYVPDLSLVLADHTVGVGESWAISRDGAEALLGTSIQRGLLAGKLVEVTPVPDGDDGPPTAHIVIDGQVLTADGLIIALLARFEFRFAGPTTSDGDGPAKATVEAPGIVSRLSLSQRASTHSAGRRSTETRQLVLETQTGDVREILSIERPP